MIWIIDEKQESEMITNEKILIVDSGYLLGSGGTAETMRTLFSLIPKKTF